jgi:hypothetical protein
MIAVVSAPIFRGTQWQTREIGSRKRAISLANRFPRTKPIPASTRFDPKNVDGPWGWVSPNEANQVSMPCPQTKPMARFPKRTHWQSRENGSRKRATSPANRFRQTNPLVRYDVLSSEKCRCSGRVGFPQTKPITILPNEPNGNLGRMGHVNGRHLPRIGFPERNQCQLRHDLIRKMSTARGDGFPRTKPIHGLRPRSPGRGGRRSVPRR